MNTTGKPYYVDARVYMALIPAGALAMSFVHTEYGMALMFAVSLLWHLAVSRHKGLGGCLFVYALLYGIAHSAIWWLSGHAGNTTAIAFSSFGVSGRKALVPLLYAILLARVPTGALLGALAAMHLPKAVGIGAAIGLRFFPTIHQEYRQIRSAQRFRGLGADFWNTLAHLPSVLANVLLPLIVRIVKISEELSASATVRGVRFRDQIVSYRPVRFCGRDAALLACTLLLYAAIILFDHYLLGVMA